MTTWILNILIAVIIFVALASGCGGADYQTLDSLRKITERVQPIVDESQKICDTAYAGLSAAGRDTKELNESCARLIDMFRAFQLIEIAAILAAGGEPCLDGCK